MLSELKFVQGAVSTKDFVPEMKHFTIKDGRVTGFNGVLALSSPIELDVSCAPKAVPLVKAIGLCQDVVSLGLTEANRLRVKSGPFKVFVDCVELEGLPEQQPSGEIIEFDGEQMLNAIKKLTPFIGSDASRPWTNGILLRGQSAFATNNVCLVEYWIGTALPFTVNVPIQAIKEMSRISEPPVNAQLSEHSITFHYADGRWLRTQLYDTNWPDVAKILDQNRTPTPAPEGLFEALHLLKPFLEMDGTIYFRGGSVYTTKDDNLGGSCEVEGLHPEGVYVHKMLSLLEGVAESVDFTAYPEPLLFYGDRLRGVILGRRL